jgi:hypothetical protein
MASFPRAGEARFETVPRTVILFIAKYGSTILEDKSQKRLAAVLMES